MSGRLQLSVTLRRPNSTEGPVVVVTGQPTPAVSVVVGICLSDLKLRKRSDVGREDVGPPHGVPVPATETGLHRRRKVHET